MKLIFIVICGAAVVLGIAFSANAWFAMLHGHPTAYATGLQLLVTRHYGLVVIVALAVVLSIGSRLFGTRDSDNSDPNWWWEIW